jgi:hypothetical protein
MFIYGLSLMWRQIEILFPPVWSRVRSLTRRCDAVRRYFRRAFGSLAQGPAAIIAREGDEISLSVVTRWGFARSGLG